MSLFTRGPGEETRRAQQDLAPVVVVRARAGLHGDPFDGTVFPGDYVECSGQLVLKRTHHAAHVESVCGDQVDRVQKV